MHLRERDLTCPKHGQNARDKKPNYQKDTCLSLSGGHSSANTTALYRDSRRWTLPWALMRGQGPMHWMQLQSAKALQWGDSAC